IKTEDGKYPYTLVPTADIKIVPQTIEVLITAPAIKTNISEAAKTITKTGIKANSDAAKRTADTFVVTDGEIADGDKLTLSYSGSYADVTTGSKTTEGKITADERDAVFAFAANGTPAVEGTNATNYTIVGYDIEYTVSTASTGGGGGGGGGTTNKLTAHYQNEDGTAGEEATEITVPLGTDPTDLIGVFKTKIANTSVTWTSSDENVVTVDNEGTLTFVGPGEATITVTSAANKQLKDTVKVVVTEAATPTPTEPTPTTAPRTHERVNDSLITKTMLNPYIVGYDDYVFGPELPISREELAAIFARLIANNLYMDQNYDTSFPDVPEKWSKSYIGYLEGFNVVTGYEDGMFRPENSITRAEMAVMMAKAEGYDITPDIDAEEAGFPDVDAGYASWSAAKAIQILSDLGIMSGYEDGTFRPGQPITRAETVATVNRVLANQEVAEREVLPSDVTDAHWAYEDIVFAMNHRVLKDAAADPHSFIWSEEFDKNMVTNTEKVAGEKEVIEGEEPSEDNTSDASAADNTEAGTATGTKDEATTPKSTDKPTI
ncbi:MAG: S-layer homology domain-containing protein, partial [Clostridia bacterium]|nr:S-layer homology domain-containing protein [Clostridia bacterium]